MEAPVSAPPRRFVFPAYQIGSRLAQLLPRGVAARLGRPLGSGLAVAMPARRRLVERHLLRAHGGHQQRRELRTEVRRSFESYARYWIESFRLSALSGAEIDSDVGTEGLEHLDAALAAGKGAILALPHVGSWDFGGAWLTRRGYPMTVVVEPVEPPELLAWFVARREAVGLAVIPLGPRAGPAVLRALRANRVVALLCDRDIAGGGVEVDFFGERTTLPGGPVSLALRTGAALLPTAVYFEGRHGHLGVMRPPLPLERRGSRAHDIARLTQDLSGELESLILRAPDQWHLFQPNWPSDPGYRH